MTKFLTLSTALAFFLATSLLVCIKTDDPNIISISTPSQELSTTSTITPDIESLSAEHFISTVRIFLPLDIFSQPDPLAGFLDRLTRNAYNNGKKEIKFLKTRWRAIFRYFVSPGYSPENQKIPLPYQPYARLMLSLLTCLIELHEVSTCVFEIQEKHSVASDYPPPPEGIQTPELLDLFSTDVFSDSKIPSVLLKKILKIPDDRMPDVTADLLKLSSTHNNAEQDYFEYVKSLRIFFENRDDILRLRYEDNEIRRSFQNNKNKTSNAK